MVIKGQNWEKIKEYIIILRLIKYLSKHLSESYQDSDIDQLKTVVHYVNNEFSVTSVGQRAIEL